MVLAAPAVTKLHSARPTVAPAVPRHTSTRASHRRAEFDDPPGLQEKTEFLLREWVSLYHSPTSGRDSTKAFTQIVHQVGAVLLDSVGLRGVVCVLCLMSGREAMGSM